MNIASFISLVITGNGIAQADIPKKFSQKKIRMIDESDISTFISSVMTEQKKGNILVITKLESIAELIRAINGNLNSNKISVICNGIADTSALEEEIKARSLHTADGRTFIPETIMNYPSLMHAGSQIIVKRKPYDNETVVFNTDGEVVGILLDESLRYENIAGTVADNMNLLDITEKASLMLGMLKNNSSDTACFSDILLIRADNKYQSVVLPSGKTQSICEAELQLFTGMTWENTFCEIIKRLAEISVPDVLAEDINRIVTNIYIYHNTPLPNYRLIKNTMERIILTEELI
ncbi:MAG: hypothetical protein K2I00_01545 [Ruminococcus sp.]|nr:hypothetical protein [Ruminococcus sp.]